MIPKQLRALAARIKPLNDNVAWFRFEYKHPTLATPELKTNRGVVLAVGPGRRQRRKLRVQTAPGHFEPMEVGAETGRVIPMTVKPGDILEFSQHGQREYTVDGVTIVISGEKSVLGYADKTDTQGVMFPTAAGWAAEDKHREVVSRVGL